MLLNFELNLGRGLKGAAVGRLEKADLLPMVTRFLAPRSNDLLLETVFGPLEKQRKNNTGEVINGQRCCIGIRQCRHEYASVRRDC